MFPLYHSLNISTKYSCWHSWTRILFHDILHVDILSLPLLSTPILLFPIPHSIINSSITSSGKLRGEESQALAKAQNTNKDNLMVCLLHPSSNHPPLKSMHSTHSSHFTLKCIWFLLWLWVSSFFFSKCFLRLLLGTYYFKMRYPHLTSQNLSPTSFFWIQETLICQRKPLTTIISSNLGQKGSLSNTRETEILDSRDFITPSNVSTHPAIKERF